MDRLRGRVRPVAEAAAVQDLGAARDHPGHPRPRRRHRARLGRRAGLLPARRPQPADRRLHLYRGRKGETKAFTWSEYRDLLIAAHRQLPGGVIVLVWDNLNVHLHAELRAFTSAQEWLRVFQLPSYAPDLNPVEGIWSVLKRGVLANLAVASFAHLIHAETPIAELVRLAKIRWRVEHDYRELKTGLGLDHFEGRSYLGWHRHVTLAVLAQAFCTMLRTDPKVLAPG